MINEYYLTLIEKLKTELPENELINLLNQIAETQEPLFINPLQDAYKIHKSSTFSHYFIYTIGKIDSPKKISFAKSTLKAKDTQFKDLNYALDILSDMKYFDQDCIDILEKKLPAILRNKDLLHKNWLIGSILSYLEYAHRLDIIDKYLHKLFKSSNFHSDVRELALKCWFLNNPTERIEFLSTNFANFKKVKGLEEYLVKVCVKLEKNDAEKVMEIIHTDGSTNAKNLLQYYQNSIPVREILAIKEEINQNSRTGVIGQDIFGRDKNFNKQLKPASSKDELVSRLNYLRSSLQNFNPILKSHGLDDNEIKKILKNAETKDYKKSINSAEIYLYSKGVILSKELGALRKLNRLISIILHPDKDEILKNLLEEFKISNEYQNQNWEDVHYKILEIYLSILKSISKKIKHC